MMVNKIFLKRKNKLIVDVGGVNTLSFDNKQLIATMMKNCEPFGYTFSKELFNVLMRLSEKDLIKGFRELIKTLQELTGMPDFKPMYPNFPEQVMIASDVELYLNAMFHYFGDFIGVRIIPKYEKEFRFPLTEQTKLTVIGLGTMEEFHQMFTDLMGSKTSLSQNDYSDLKEYLIEFYPKEKVIFPEKIYFKETLTFITSCLLNMGVEHLNSLYRYYKNPTDILRLAVSLSDGDVSLKDSTRFRKFSRKERKLFLKLLENIPQLKEGMKKYDTRWIRLGEIIHPGDYKKQFPKSFDAFTSLRNNEKIETFNSKIELYLQKQDLYKAVNLLLENPGEFARRLDHLLRIADDDDFMILYIIGHFGKITSHISTPVLLQIHSHFKHRNDEVNLRVFFPKGNIAKGYVKEEKLNPLNKKAIDQILYWVDRTLFNRFKELKPLGNVYVDPELKNYIIPFSQRSASNSLRTLIRGSRFDIKDKNTIRFFLYWKDLEDTKQSYRNRVDIDLSAVMLDSDWKYMEHISYTNLRSLKYKSCHSGDITSAPNGASEFIDIDLDSIEKYGGRYIMMSVLSFTEQSFNEIPICAAGWMMRDDPQSGEIYDPKTVENKFGLTSEATTCIPLIIDVIDRKVIWADIALKSSYRCNNVENNLSNLSLMAMGIVNMEKENLEYLFKMHGASRGNLVAKEEDADFVFGIEKGHITPFDFEKIISNFL